MRYILALPLAAVLAFPFWFTPLLRVDHEIEVGIYLLVTIAITFGLGIAGWVERVTPTTRVTAGLAAIATGAAVYIARPPFTGAVAELLAIAWGMTALGAWWHVKDALRLRARLSVAKRYGIGFVLAASAAIVLDSAWTWLGLHPAGMAVVVVVGTAGLALVPGRYTNN